MNYTEFEEDWSDTAFMRYLVKYKKRTGIFRLYSYVPSTRKARLLLEFVWRGNVLFKWRLWRTKDIFKHLKEGSS